MAMSIPTFAAEATPAPISLASPIATLELPVGDSLPIDDQISPTETKFTLQGDSVLEGIPTFTSNNNLYVPFMDLVDLFNIGWESDSAGNINFTSNPLPEKFINNVSLAIDPMKAAAPMSAHAPASMLPDFEEGGPVADLPWSSDIPTGPAPIIYVPDPERPTTDENEVIIEGEGILMENVYIVDVRDNKGQISVVVGNPQDPENPMDQTIFHLNDKTNIKHIMNRRLYTPADLKAGQTINVRHAEAMTMSIPAQVAAYEITLVSDATDAATDTADAATVMENVRVLEVSTKDGKVTSIAVGDKDETEPHTIFSFKENTAIRHIRDRRIYKLEDLKSGQVINVSYSGPVMQSYPAQAIADQIILIDAIGQ
ncbi:hypothetical protein AN640_05795 [Candidatus Epulonipiscium fishelsonii]|uniref:Uncharacterized protein n=1 Tax=Candidatus Epulonipiscium fishelsonii TaxID=77094 RepID=A0ACC8XHM5_9FIRM|nr:hypothetical protein AN640_05795 [Epulopiscium sp. SCG-D08WGA-EpuloA1]